MTAKAQGFKTFVRRNLTLLAGRASELNISLELGEVTQSVEVTDAAVLLDRRSADQTATLTGAMVAQLPTSTRNPLNFVFALAGTTPPTTSYMYSPDSSTDQSFNTFGLQGGRSGSSQVLLDGVPATAADWGGLIVAPTVEAVQEMQVVRNTYDAQYGKSGGGIITIVSKGGTSKFHGTGYEFLRAENLDATSWSSNKDFWPADRATRI